MKHFYFFLFFTLVFSTIQARDFEFFIDTENSKETVTIPSNDSYHCDYSVGITKPIPEPTIATCSNVINTKGSASSNLAMDSNEDPSIIYEGPGFTENPTNNGSVSGSITASLKNDTYASNPLNIGTDVTLNNIPAGLTPMLTVEQPGTVWTSENAIARNLWMSVAYGNGTFVVVAQSGDNRVITSTDGITWTPRVAAERGLAWQSITFGEGLFVAVSADGTNRVMTSPDGINWTARTAAEQNFWTSVTYGNGRFIAIARRGRNRVMTSPDGINWTARSASEQNDWLSVTYGRGQFVAVALDGTHQVMTSPNGINWTARTAPQANVWRSVTYGNGRYVAISQDGANRVMTSHNGIDWTLQNAAEQNRWASVTYGNKVFVAVAYLGTNPVMTSPDGVTWTPYAIPTSVQGGCISVAYGGDQFVAVGQGGGNRVMTANGNSIATLTLNGTATNHEDINDVANIRFNFADSAFTNTPAASVTNATGPASSNIGIDFNENANIIYSGTGFTENLNNDGSVIGSITATLENDTYTKSPLTVGTDVFLGNIPDGLTPTLKLEADITDWTSQTAPEDNPWLSVAYGNNLFVAVAREGTHRVMTSPDGIVWTARTAAVQNNWISVTYGNGKFVAVAASGTNRVMTSSDGINWTAHAAAEQNSWISVTYGNGQFVSVAASGTNRVMTSPDGINWTAQTATEQNQWVSITYGNSKFAAISIDGTNRIMTSPDGVTWTARTVAAQNSWNSITYGNGLFVAVSLNGTKPVMTSPDGITWTARAAVEQSSWYQITYGNGLFVALARSGPNRIMTSPDGIAWSVQTTSIWSLWTSITYGNGQFVAVARIGTNLIMTAGNNKATLTLDGTATNHEDSNDIADISFNFTDSAFNSTPAASVTNATGPASSNLGIDFRDLSPLFITTWETATPNETITIPTVDTEVYDYTIDWGDGTVDTNVTGNAVHTYTSVGEHVVKIHGDFPRILFNNSGDKEKIKSIDQWGSNKWSSMAFAFWGCANLKIKATDHPDFTQTTSLRSMFRNCSSITTPDFSGWNVSTITDMDAMFSGALNFNGNVTTWDVGNVVFFGQTFAFTDLFNQDISSWNVGERVSNSDFIAMNRMFRRARSFNRDLSNWDVSRAGTFKEMFRDTEAFDQSLGDWDISGLFSSGALDDMFRNTVISSENYDSTLIGWATLDADETQIPLGMTLGAYELSYCLAAEAKNTLESSPYFWTINDAGRNCDAIAFITTWETTSANERITIPTTGAGYNYSIDWGDGTIEDNRTGNRTHQYATAQQYQIKIWGDFPRIYFSDAGDKDKILSIDQWGTIEWTNMQNAFMGCSKLTVADDAGAPDLSKVTVLNNMFADSGINTTGNLNSWDVSNVRSFYRMFIAASNFNQPLDQWNVSNAISLRGIFHHAIKFNQDISAWNVGNCRNFAQMFLTSDNQTHLFNQDISGWNVGELVTDTQNIEMYSMFKNAKNFDADLSGWDVSRVTNFNQMFYNTLSFDYNLGDWDISNATNMELMFQGVTLSKENYEAILEGWATLSTSETTIPVGLTFDGGNSTYCNISARNILTNDPFDWIITDGGLDCDFTNAFITTWETTMENESITIPTTGDGYDYIIDWGDGTMEADFTGNATHQYTTAGEYVVKIIGDFPRIYFNRTGDKDKILSVDQWGSIQWISFDRAFLGCTNLDVPAADAPDLTLVDSLADIFNGCHHLGTSSDLDFSNWDTSGIVSFQDVFQNAISFNSETIKNWDVGNGRFFSGMFASAVIFNQNISNWNIGEHVTAGIGMPRMFSNALKFNQPIGEWDTSKVTNFFYMFERARDFDQNLGGWDISNVTNMINMLNDSGLSIDNYDATLIDWATLDAGETQIPSNITLDANGLFYCLAEEAKSILEGNSYNWIINDNGLDCFNAFITTWETTMENESITIPTTGDGYDYTVDWGDGTIEADFTGNATHQYTTAGEYVVKIIGDFPRIYFNNGAEKTKIKYINQWGTNQWNTMEHAFFGCSNLDVLASDTPDLSNVNSLSDMFRFCTSLGTTTSNTVNWNWNTSNISKLSRMFDSTKFNDSAIVNWDVGNVNTFLAMFLNTTEFNQDISGWNIGEYLPTGVNIQMAYMLTFAVEFNQPIGLWDMSKVNNISFMFSNARKFNQPLDSWDVSNVTIMNDLLVTEKVKTMHFSAFCF